MKRTIWTLLFLGLISWTGVPPASGQVNPATLTFQADPYELWLPTGPYATDWQAGSMSDAHHAGMIEFVRKGDDINNWKELFTYQVFKRKDYPPSPEEYLKALKERREKDCPGATQWNTIQQHENSILYEWQLMKPCVGAPGEAQAGVEEHEIARVFYEKDVIFVVHYAAKGHELAPDVRTEWINSWEDAYVTVGGVVNEVVPFAMDNVTLALKAAMESKGCHITNATVSQIECERARVTSWTEQGSGGEKVTAALTADDNQTRVRIWTGKGFYGRLVKKDWAGPIYNTMLADLRNAHP